MKKQIISIVLCLCLILGLTPGAALGAEEGSGSVPAPEAEARYQTAEGGDWVYGSLADACANVYAGGRVEVLRDIDQPTPAAIGKPMTLTSVDPEAPCTVTYTTQKREDPYLLTTTADVTLEHIILDGGREEGFPSYTELVGVRNGTLTLGAGAVLQNNDNVDKADSAGGLRVMSSGTAVMQAGSVIRGCRAVAGGGAGVASQGATLVLNGGAIEDCEAYIGGGVYVKGKGKLYLYENSLIRHNWAKKILEGISISDTLVRGYLRGGGGGIFVMSGYVYLLGEKNGGAVAENTAEGNGGGIFFNAGVLQLANCSVTGNSTAGYGGGVLTNPSVTVVAGNSPRVTGNTSGNGYDNMYLDGGEDGDTDLTVPILMGTPLGDNAYISVSRWVKPSEEHPYRMVAEPFVSQTGAYEILDSDLDKFHSDDPAYTLLFNEERSIVLATADVFFDAQGHGVQPRPQHLGESRKITDPGDLTETGYTFGGWFTDLEHQDPWDFEDGIVTETQEIPLTLYAKWELTSYSITYELNGGAGTEDPQNYTIQSETITLNAPTREGYTFQGWVEDGQGEPQVEATIPTGSTGNKVFTAQWDPVIYSISCDTNGGIAVENPTDYTIESEDITLSNPTREGYTFLGWVEDGQGEPQVEATIPTGSTGDKVFTAQWDPVIYSISCDTNGGIAVENPTDYTIESEDITLSNPTREGYTFQGWVENGQGEPQVEVTIPTGSTGDKVFTAQWDPVIYSISYDTNGGIAVENPTDYTIESEDITLNAPTREGYTFLGWIENGQGEPQVEATIPTGSTGDKVFTAQWTPVSYSITYDLDGGSVDGNPTAYTIESEDITLNAPTKEGYTFLGWTWAEQSEPQMDVTIPHGSTGNKVFTAQWEKNVVPKPAASGGETPGKPIVLQPEKGKVVISPTHSKKGDKVIITITPEDGYVPDTVTVTDADGNPVEVTPNPDGTYTFVQPEGKVTISAVMKAKGVPCPRDETCPIWPYTDASTTAWYHDGVHFCIARGLMEGYGNNIFAPYDTLSRGMLAQILYNEEGRPAVSGEAPFDDVAPDAWYTEAITWCAGEGVVKGYGDGRFGPEDPVTREQLAAMLWRYAKTKGYDVSVGEDTNISSFTDFTAASEWAIPALQWAVGSGVVIGKEGSRLDPTGLSTRAEAATMLQRYFQTMGK